MSKQYKDKTCVYCAQERASSTGDHVIARSFFPKDLRQNLPQVPACSECNTTKSTLETYLSALLPQGARHQEDVSTYWADSRRRIDKNQKLYREMQAGAEIFKQVDEVGNANEKVGIPIDSDKYLELSKLIAKGLFFHHWSVLLPQAQIIHAQFISKVGELNYSNIVATLKNAANITLEEHASKSSVKNDAHISKVNIDDFIKSTGLVQLGSGAVTYEGTFVPGDKKLSVWRLNFYQAELGIPGSTETTSSIMMLIPSDSQEFTP